MPALPSVPNVVKVAVSGLIDGAKPWVNLFHLGWSVGGSISAAEVLAVANNIAGGWGTNIAPSVSDTIELLQVVVTALASSTAPEATVATATPGLVTTQPVSGGTSFVTQRKIARRYRGGHSRVYLPGVAAAELDDTELEWDATFAAAFANDWGAVEQGGATTLVSNGFTDATPVSVSYYEFFTNVLYPSGRYHVKPTLRATPLVDKITAYAPNPRPCSQRRRQQP